MRYFTYTEGKLLRWQVLTLAYSIGRSHTYFNLILLASSDLNLSEISAPTWLQKNWDALRIILPLVLSVFLAYTSQRCPTMTSLSCCVFKGTTACTVTNEKELLGKKTIAPADPLRIPMSLLRKSFLLCHRPKQLVQCLLYTVRPLKCSDIHLSLWICSVKRLLQQVSGRESSRDVEGGMDGWRGLLICLWMWLCTMRGRLMWEMRSLL